MTVSRRLSVVVLLLLTNLGLGALRHHTPARRSEWAEARSDLKLRFLRARAQRLALAAGRDSYSFETPYCPAIGSR